MKLKKILQILFLVSGCGFAQNNSLNYFLDSAEKNNPSLLENQNLQQIQDLQNKLIKVQNNSFQVDVTSEVMVAPYFNNNGKFIDVTTNPSPNAYGYAEPVSNGALYSAQLNVTKNIFNRARVQNLLFQNKLKNQSLQLSAEEIKHQLQKNIITAYIQVYHFQLKEKLYQVIISDLENRLKVVEVLVKKGILMQSDYLLLKLTIENKKLELQQTKADLLANYLQLDNASGIEADTIRELSPPDIRLNVYATNRAADSVSNYNLKVNDSIMRSSNAKNNVLAARRETLPYHYQQKYRVDSLKIAAEEKVFENKYKPKLSAYGNTGLNAVEVSRIPHNVGVSAGVKLTVPIYDGGQKKIKELENKLKYENLENYRKNKRIVRNNTLQSLQEQLISIKKSIHLINDQLKKQTDILEIYKGKMVQGQVSIIDYLNVVQDYKMNLETRLQMQTNLWLLKNEYNATNW